MITQKDYLKPLNHGHFFWTDFEPIFNFKFRKNSLGDLLLSDFQKSLRANHIKVRQIIGADDSLYVGGSKSQTLALNELDGILKDIGFKVWKLPQDHTIRVYPKKMKQRPLINPRFYSSGEWLEEDLIHECLIIMCYVNGNEKKDISKLQNLDFLKNIFSSIRIYDEFVYADYNYYYRYSIYVPLEFVKAKNSFDLDWKFLRKLWQKIYDILAT